MGKNLNVAGEGREGDYSRSKARGTGKPPREMPTQNQPKRERGTEEELGDDSADDPSNRSIRRVQGGKTLEQGRQTPCPRAKVARLILKVAR